MPSGHAKRAVILSEDLLQLVRVARRVPFFFLRACSTAPFNMTLAIEALSLGVSFKNSCFSLSKSSPAKGDPLRRIRGELLWFPKPSNALHFGFSKRFRVAFQTETKYIYSCDPTLR